jgi:prophage regulatory protein
VQAATPQSLTAAPAERLLRLPAVLDRVGLGKSSIYQKVDAGEFPAPVKLSPSGRAVGWPESVITAYIAGRVGGVE